MGEHAAGPASEQGQEVELLGREVDDAPGHGHAVPEEVDPKVAHLQLALGRG